MELDSGDEDLAESLNTQYFMMRLKTLCTSVAKVFDVTDKDPPIHSCAVPAGSLSLLPVNNDLTLSDCDSNTESAFTVFLITKCQVDATRHQLMKQRACAHCMHHMDMALQG